MPWIVYETINKVNGKKYIGVHRQSGTEFDGYLGSGAILEAAVAKHGRDAFERRTLFVFRTAEKAYAKEKELVSELWVSSTATYNIKHGGLGGTGYRQSEESRQKIREYRTGQPHSEQTREKIRQARTGKPLSLSAREKLRQTMLGRTHSPEIREKISKGVARAWEAKRNAP